MELRRVAERQVAGAICRTPGKACEAGARRLKSAVRVRRELCGAVRRVDRGAAELETAAIARPVCFGAGRSPKASAEALAETGGVLR